MFKAKTQEKALIKTSLKADHEKQVATEDTWLWDQCEISTLALKPI